MAADHRIATSAQPDLAFFARELKVLFWAPERLL